MLYYTGLLILVIAVSLDGFGVGVTYGIRKIHIPLFALFIIMCCSGVVVLLAMTMGSMLSTFISPHFAKVIGGCILIALGLFSLYNHLKTKKKQNHQTKRNRKKRAHFFNILSTPDQADLDHSGIISPNEALLLGIALALDAFGAGLGASIIGYQPLMTSLLIAFMSGAFVYAGIRTGFFIAKMRHLQKMAILPSLLLISIGIYNIIAT